MLIHNLLCEYTNNPIGLNTTIPRFSWRTKCFDGRGRYQTAYQILVSTNADILSRNQSDLWNSGKIESNKSINIEYLGKPLQSVQLCYWKVRIWDEEGNPSEYSDIASFEVGLLDKKDWKGEWITSPEDSAYQSYLFRKTFFLEKSIKKARAYISGLGYYELRINGKKTGDHVLDPGWTDYSKRVLYVAYDVSKSLMQGNNTIGVILGNGWRFNPGFPSEGYRKRCEGQTLLIMQMNIEYDDGTFTSIVTDTLSGWEVAKGPIRSNSIYSGEHYDARMEKPGWDKPEYNPEKSEWLLPVKADSPTGYMVLQDSEPIKVVQDICPINLAMPKRDVYVYDVGQNIAGWAKIKVRGNRGDKITLKYAETLYEDGTVNQENLRLGCVMDTYILKGEYEETYEPRFTYHGFRYVQVEGVAGLGLGSITARVVRSSVDATGEFTCSNQLLNKIQQNVVWTEQNNLHSIPTDCPQRNERLGWLNDATVRAEEAIYNFNMSRFYPKWINDIKDTQNDHTGSITNTAPDAMPIIPGYWEHTHADAVCSSYLIIPWLLYLHYGDKRVLEQHYQGLKKWSDFLGTKAENHIVQFSQMGDWASPISECITDSVGSGAVSKNTPGILISTGYYFYNHILLSKIAAVLGKSEESLEYLETAEKIREAFNHKFFDEESYQYAKGSQASNVFPLYLGITEKKHVRKVFENLVKDIVEVHDNHLTTGNLCSKYLMEALTDAGHGDVAYQLAKQDTYPSWGYMIRKGATTVWERWEEGVGGGMNSHNHPMYGSISAWFYKHLGGINVDAEGPGFQKIIIRPFIPEKLTYVNCSLNTIMGCVESNWEKENDTLSMNLKIPFNSTARVFISRLNPSSHEVVMESNKIIWENNSCKSKPQGILGVEETNEHIIFDLGSGTYSLKYVMK